MDHDPTAPGEPSPTYLKTVARICQEALAQARLRKVLRAARNATPVALQPKPGDPEASHE